MVNPTLKTTNNKDKVAKIEFKKPHANGVNFKSKTEQNGKSNIQNNKIIRQLFKNRYKRKPILFKERSQKQNGKENKLFTD